jgi:hypothetical protein
VLRNMDKIMIMGAVAGAIAAAAGHALTSL